MALELFGDFGAAGAESANVNEQADSQRCINWYPEVAISKRAKVPVSLLGCPGLNQLVAAPGGGAPGFSASMTQWPVPSAITNLPVRCLWVLPGSLQALAVIANACYLVTMSSSPTASSLATLSMTQVGTLLSSSGPVHIRDNGVGGTAVLVDGVNGYFYAYNSASPVGPIGTLSTITDPNWLGAATVGEIDGWWIFSQPNTQTFFTNAQPYSTAFNASYFALKDAASDQLMGVIENKEELWLPGERTTEIWYDAGGQYFPFQRLVGTMLQVGCKATHSIARISFQGQDGLIWFGRSERGENIIIITVGFSYEVVSTPHVSNEIASYPVTSDAIGYTYQEDTHEFYVLTFPTADRTWVFDASVPLEFAWHERLSYDPYADALHRHRSNAFMNFAGMRIVGDYQNGALYQYTRSAYTDAGWPLLARRRAPHVWDGGERQRVFLSMLQVDFGATGGASTGLGANPQAYLRLSKDGGKTFGQRWAAAIGAIGQTLARTIWRKLSFARDSVVELEVIAPVRRDVVGATLRASGQE